MHYKTRRTAKERSMNFNLPKNYLEALGLVADLEQQSRSVIAELCFQFWKGEKDGNLAKLKRKYYKRSHAKKRGKRIKRRKFCVSQENEPRLFEITEWL